MIGDWEFKPNVRGKCILYTGKLDRKGYGYPRGIGVHRTAWEAKYGPIPKGMTIDHLCRVKNCINPKHMEVVTSGENSRRGKLRTHCKRGHSMTGENLSFEPSGKRRCKECRRITISAYTKRRIRKRD